MESFPNTALLYATDTSTYTDTDTDTPTAKPKSMTPCVSTAVTITVSTASLRQEPANLRISYLTLEPSLVSSVSLVTVFN